MHPLDNEKSDQSDKNSQTDSSDDSSSFSKSDKQQIAKSPSTHTLDAKSDQAVSSENLSKKSTESTPLKLKVEKQFNEKDLNCTRESESEYFNGVKQDEFNKQCELDDIEFVPHFQRVYISGDDNSGVCFDRLFSESSLRPELLRRIVRWMRFSSIPRLSLQAAN